MKRVITLIAVAALTTGISGCQMNKQAVGSGVGGVAGGVLGSNIGGGTGRTAAIIGGTLLGAMIGGHIGSEMDELDRRRTYETFENTPTGRSNSWNNPDTGAQ